MLAILILLCKATLADTPDGSGAGLFASEMGFSIEIIARWKELLQERGSRPRLAAKLIFSDDSGTNGKIDVEVEPRGHHRLETCSFPPLRIRIPTETARGTPFEGHRKLKLVTHCARSSRGERWLRREFIAYRLFAELAEHSFGVRWVSVRYSELDEPSDEPMPAFFIEDSRSVRNRLDVSRVSREEVEVADLDARQASLVALFQYLIGNTDWSMIRAPDGESCCHNVKLMASAKSPDRLLPLPYDFDQSGLVNASYASPSPLLRIQSVRTRVYRGMCRHNGALAWAIERALSRRGKLEEVITGPFLAERDRKAVMKYVDRFFVTVEDPRRLQRELYGKCRGAQGS